MADWATILITVVGSVAASSGFWAFLHKKSDKKDSKTKLLLGLAHDRIIYLGMLYIERQAITQDEYENLHDYLYIPYVACGGNGTATRIMNDVSKIDIERRTFRTNKGDE